MDEALFENDGLPEEDDLFAPDGEYDSLDVFEDDDT